MLIKRLQNKKLNFRGKKRIERKKERKKERKRNLDNKESLFLSKPSSAQSWIKQTKLLFSLYSVALFMGWYHVRLGTSNYAYNAH